MVIGWGEVPEAPVVLSCGVETMAQKLQIKRKMNIVKQIPSSFAYLCSNDKTLDVEIKVNAVEIKAFSN